MKRFLALVPFFLSLFFVFIFTSFSISDSPYVIDRDVTLYDVVQPSSFAWRVVDGILQRRDGFGNWVNANQNLNQLFNDYNIATLADVQASAVTIPDLVSSYSQYFGTFPFSYTRRISGTSAIDTTSTVSSFQEFFSLYGSDISRNLISYSGTTYLNASGLRSVSGYNQGLAAIEGAGFLGLSANIVGMSGSVLFDNNFDSVSVSSLLSGLSVLNSNLSSKLYIGGTSSALLSDGTISDVNNIDLPEINSQGFRGLAQILRGPSSSEGTLNFVNYSNLSTEDVFNSNLFSLLATGLSRIQNDFAYYMYSHGTDLDIRERENMQQQANTFVDEFTSSTGNGTPSVSDISDSAGVSSGLKNSFNTGASAADAFNQLNDSDNYSFFSTQVQSELNPFLSSRGYSSSDDGFVDFVDSHLDDILGGIGSSW